MYGRLAVLCIYNNEKSLKELQVAELQIIALFAMTYQVLIRRTRRPMRIRGKRVNRVP